VFPRAFIAVAGLCLAVAVGGCSLTPTSSSSTAGFTGPKAPIATALNLFASDSSSGNGADLCKNVFATAVRKRLNQVGNCTKSVDDQLKTTDDFTLTVEAIKVTGANASAQVLTIHDRKKVISTVTLVRQGGTWRVDSI
jgi:hypothetical protein